MRSKVLIAVVLAALIAAAVAAAPASAITYGEPDGAGHPYVGAIVADFQGQLQVVATGTLIAPRIVLTASHATAFIQSFTDDVYVTFAPVFDATDTQALYHGTMYTNPGFSQRQNDPGDVAVVVLDKAPPITTPVTLPPAGIFDRMAAAHTLAGQTFTNVGYGSLPFVRGGGPRVLSGIGTRRVSVSSFMALTPAWLCLSQNPTLGWGGGGPGDSGGPIFLGTSTMLASIDVKGDGALRSTNISYRLDTPAARAFLGQFVTLP